MTQGPISQPAAIAQQVCVSVCVSVAIDGLIIPMCAESSAVVRLLLLDIAMKVLFRWQEQTTFLLCIHAVPTNAYRTAVHFSRISTVNNDTVLFR